MQTAGDASYGTTVPEGRCWRCLDREADPESTAGVCAPCREVLLADPEPDDVEADWFRNTFLRMMAYPIRFIPPWDGIRLSRPRWYDRLGLPISIEEAETLHSDPDYQRVAVEVMGDAVVSTVWLGLDYGFGGGPPLIFETLVIGGPLDGEQFRYSTDEQAVVGHRMMVDRVRAARENP